MTSRVRPFRVTLLLTVLISIVTPAAQAQWVEFVEQTDTRFAEDVQLDSPQETDFAWGDVDRDGDIDLVIVRKEPFTSPGKFPNYLLLNENGVFHDRTSLYATDADVSGDDGFDTPTNDRDVKLADVNNDGWLDIITATTISDDDPKSIGHPRIYINEGCETPCVNHAPWLGFRYEANRIPTMDSWSGQSGHNPRFCSVDAADVTGDGYVDLWFGDYDSSGVDGATQPAGADFNDRLLINAGAAAPGFFFDETSGPGSRFSGNISIPGGESTPFPVSAFGAAANIADLNGDGFNEIIKQTSLNSPTYVGAAYNDPFDEGQFADFQVFYQIAPYFVSVGDLNNDERLDLVITDDGDDRYVINQGNAEDGQAILTSYVFQFNHVGFPPPQLDDDGFGGNSLIVDLDNDGWDDVVIADVDVDIGPCDSTRRMHIYQNLGDVQENGYVSLVEQTSGSNCDFFATPAPQCLVTGIPSNKLQGVHDVAVFDVDGDGWKDIVLGRCDSMEVWMNVPPATPAGSIADGDTPPSQQLQLGKLSNGRVDLSWGESCVLVDDDYAVYEGSIEQGFESHEGRICSTGGLTSIRFVADSASSYYLVVPRNRDYEGSYGFARNPDATMTPRQQGVTVCDDLPMVVGSCE